MDLKQTKAKGEEGNEPTPSMICRLLEDEVVELKRQAKDARALKGGLNPTEVKSNAQNDSEFMVVDIQVNFDFRTYGSVLYQPAAHATYDKNGDTDTAHAPSHPPNEHHKTYNNPSAGRNLSHSLLASGASMKRARTPPPDASQGSQWHQGDHPYASRAREVFNEPRGGNPASQSTVLAYSSGRSGRTPAKKAKVDNNLPPRSKKKVSQPSNDRRRELGQPDDTGLIYVDDEYEDLGLPVITSPIDADDLNAGPSRARSSA
ncbi:hypothetical protein FB451DRAFT_1190470 [Mycena latifolia]|nr:hypothetical protein FB451DRAFT_1190470 [Mycena latifolia]